MKSKWICCQIGAREHYAIPRALLRKELLAGLVTDYWMDGGFAARLASGVAAQLGSRFHEELKSIPVTCFNSGFLKLEAESKLLRKSGWEPILDRNRWFQKNAAAKLDSMLTNTGAQVVFSYSYGAKQPFEIAKQHGCQCVLGQIDPGLFEWQLVDKIRAQHGFALIELPPASYWEDWKAECELADTIVVNSTWSRQALIEQGIDDNKIRVVPLAYETSAGSAPIDFSYPEVFSNERPLQILYLGQVIPRKGMIELIGAIGELQKKPVSWTIVGGGETKLLDQLNQFANVKSIGQVDRQKVIDFYRQADIFILPTHSDGFAITLLEAASFGVPIIASPFCGDVVRDGVDGIQLREVSVPAIVDAVQQILASPGLLCRFSVEQSRRKLRTIDELAGDLVNLMVSNSDDAN